MPPHMERGGVACVILQNHHTIKKKNIIINNYLQVCFYVASSAGEAKFMFCFFLIIRVVPLKVTSCLSVNSVSI